MIALLLALLASPSHASLFGMDDYKVSVVQRTNVQEIYFEGNIAIGQAGSVIRELKSLEQNKDMHIFLHSGGGYLKGIEKIKAHLRKICPRGACSITTEVSRFRKCASACVHFFMLGDERLASVDSAFGFHRAWTGLPQRPLSLPGFAEKTLLKSGVDKRWLRKNADLFERVDHPTWRAPEQLAGSNIVTRIME